MERLGISICLCARQRSAAPIAEKLNSIPHFLGRDSTHQAGEPPHLLADAVALLPADDYPRMRPSAIQEIRVQPEKVRTVERIDDTAPFRGVRQVLAILAFDHAGFKGGLDVHGSSA